ncbi:hypothetical protein F4802DRAFT_603099 [Xylaria palmicola]|nr:hypothetical protein F4802DRAFT_603099 [Xylaria palmicola]
MAASTSTSTEPRILLTGASGFIGGSVLTQLLNSSSPSLRSGPITCLVRGADRVTKLKEAYGARVNPVLYRESYLIFTFDVAYQGLDDLETATAVAAQHDVVISATLGIHTASVRALLEGLARRKRARPGSEPWLIHTSGTSNLASRPFADDAPAAGSGSGSCSSNGRTFDDAADDIYGYEVAREAAAAYPQRTTELGVVNAGLELGVRTSEQSPPPSPHHPSPT